MGSPIGTPRSDANHPVRNVRHWGPESSMAERSHFDTAGVLPPHVATGHRDQRSVQDVVGGKTDDLVSSPRNPTGPTTASRAPPNVDESGKKRTA